MADEKPGDEPEVDVDSLDDKAFEDLKGKMRGDDEPAPAEAEQQAADRVARDEQGRFAKAEPKEEQGEPEEQGEAERQKSDTVPHAKFHQANERRKAAEAEAAKAKDRLRQLLEMQPAAPQQPEVPNAPADPMNGLAWAVDEVAAIKRERAEQAAQREEYQRAEAIYSEAARVVSPVLTAQEEADPTIRAATEYLRNSVARELLSMGYGQQQAREQLQQMERDHVFHIATNNLDPGGYIKALAGARGWNPQPVVEQQQQVDPAAQISQREEARKASLSLGKTGGGVTNTAAITPEQLLEMSDAEFEAYKKKHGGSVAAAFVN